MPDRKISRIKRTQKQEMTHNMCFAAGVSSSVSEWSVNGVCAYGLYEMCYAAATSCIVCSRGLPQVLETLAGGDVETKYYLLT